MKKRSENFDARCWAVAKQHLNARSQEHVIALIERVVELNELKKEERDE